MIRNILCAGLQQARGLARWFGAGCCLCLLLAAAERGACWPANTTIGVTLYEQTIYRDAWEAAYPRSMFAAITLSQGGDRSENEIKMQGHRSGTLWPDEDYWAMTTAYLILGRGVTAAQYQYPFGPPCIQPDDSMSWNQYYTFSATILAGMQYTSSSDTLTVINEFDGGLGMISPVIEETL